MIHPDLFLQVVDELSKVFKCAPENFHRGTCAADIEGWDSLSNIRMLLRLEEIFYIRFTGMEAAGLENVGELVDMVAEKIKS